MSSSKKLPIHLVTFKDGHTMCSTMMRFQDYYESPYYRKRIFSRESFEDHYAKTMGAFTYYEDWGGFNLPSWVLKPFRAGIFEDLTEKEQAFLDLTEDLQGDFYIIAVVKSDLLTLSHEIVHGLFYVDKEYQKKVLAVLADYETKWLKKALRKDGYHRAVHDDEINAYLLTGAADSFADIDYRALQRSLHNVFTKHFGYSIRGDEAKKSLARLVHKRKWPDVRTF